MGDVFDVQQVMAHVAARTADGRTAAVVAALLAEYQATKDAITHNVDYMFNLRQLAFGTLAGLFTGVGAVLAGIVSNRAVNYQQISVFIFGVVPLLYFVLVCLYADCIHRINQTACYIEQVLRVKFQEVTGTPVWDWEQYLATMRRHSRTRSLRHIVGTLLDQIRWAVFLVPMLLCLVALMIAQFTWTLGVEAVVLFIGDLVLVTITIAIACLSQEGTGVVASVLSGSPACRTLSRGSSRQKKLDVT